MIPRLLVVPRRTSQTPGGAWVGDPDLFTKAKSIELIQISVVFTSDIDEGERLLKEWERFAKKVEIGGPAYSDPGGEFTPGKFVKAGVVHTSRGCVRKCPWCYVPKREGQIRELKIREGNIIQDNNLLACSRRHFGKVVEMLRTQSGIKFSGGLDARLLRDHHIDDLRSLRVFELWTAADSIAVSAITRRAVEKLRKAGFSKRKIRCYCMIGFDGESLEDAEARLLDLYNAGSVPFAQIYDQKKDVSHEWRKLAKTWSRPAMIKMKYGGAW